MAQVLSLRPHTFRLDNCIVDEYAAEMGAIGVAIYVVLQRYANRTTGQCFPTVDTIAQVLGLSHTCVKKYLKRLARLGLLDRATRYTAEGDPTSNLYTLHDPTQRDAVQRRQRRREASFADGGGSPGDPPPQPSGHLATGGGSPGVPKQDPVEQYLTSVAASKTAEQPCEHPAHEHRSPVPGLRICVDCFRCWPVPLAVLSPAGDPAGSAGQWQPTAGRG
jgi:hypothetical protein